MPPLVDFLSYPADTPAHTNPRFTATPFPPSHRDSLSKPGQNESLPRWKGWVHQVALRIGIDALVLAGLVTIKYLASPLPTIALSHAAPYQPLEPPLPGESQQPLLSSRSVPQPPPSLALPPPPHLLTLKDKLLKKFSSCNSEPQSLNLKPVNPHPTSLTPNRAPQG